VHIRYTEHQLKQSCLAHKPVSTTKAATPLKSIEVKEHAKSDLHFHCTFTGPMCLRKNTIFTGIRWNKYLQNYQGTPIFSIFDSCLQLQSSQTLYWCIKIQILGIYCKYLPYTEG